jgi:RimJ/RimL family protein N-acetyltransferase
MERRHTGLMNDLIEIHTRRLSIAPVVLSEAQSLADLVTAKVSLWTAPIPWPYTIADANDWIANTSPDSRMGIRLDGKLIGMTGLPAKDGEEAGFWINERYEGQGFATEAVGGVIEFAFVQRSLDVLESVVHRDNAASRRVHEKLGFTIVDETNRYWSNKNREVPVVIFRLTARDWKAHCAQGTSLERQ